MSGGKSEGDRRCFEVFSDDIKTIIGVRKHWNIE